MFCNKKAQSVVEYLVYFAIVALLSLLSVNVFFPRILQAGEKAFNEARGEILK